MEVSVSLPDEDIEFLDDYVVRNEMASRSAAVHPAIRLLRTSGLGAFYEQAWSEWSGDGDCEIWEHVISDGVT